MVWELIHIPVFQPLPVAHTILAQNLLNPTPLLHMYYVDGPLLINADNYCNKVPICFLAILVHLLLGSCH